MQQTMEKKIEEQKEKQTQKTDVWDCGSSLYDSFELKSFERYLDSAITSRTLSMPHLPDRHLPDRQAHRAQPKAISKKSSSKFSRSFNKLVKSVFGLKGNTGSLFSDLDGSREDGFYFVYDKPGSLSAIPKVAEKAAEYGSVSPDADESLVKRAASERFTATSVGITCAIFFR